MVPGPRTPRKPRFSVVIPTLNEAPWLPRLLTCLRPIRSVAEVIVVDANSSDETVSLAEGFGCRIVHGGRPAVARNRGAEVARGEMLLFVDADVYPTLALLKHTQSVGSHGVDVVCYRHVPITDGLFIRSCYRTADAWFKVLHRRGVGQAMANYLLVRRSTFALVGGFDEGIEACEDLDFVRRIGKVGAVRYERSVPVLVSARRFRTESAGIFLLKTMVWEPLRLVGSRRSIFSYCWRPHHVKIARDEAFWLAYRGYLGPTHAEAKQRVVA